MTPDQEPLLICLGPFEYKNLLREIYLRDHAPLMVDLSCATVTASCATRIECPPLTNVVSNHFPIDMAACWDQRSRTARRAQCDKRKRARAARNRLRKHRAR